MRINEIRPHFGGRIFYRLFAVVQKLRVPLYSPGLCGVVRQSLNHAFRGDIGGGEKGNTAPGGQGLGSHRPDAHAGEGGGGAAPVSSKKSTPLALERRR